MNSIKVLGLFYYFPPSPTVGSLRTYNISQALSEIGFDFVVFTRNLDKKLIFKWSLDKPKAKIVRVKYFDFKKIVNFRYNRVTTSKLKKGGRLIWKLKESPIINLFFGEGGPLYIFRILIKASKYIKENDISVIMSSYRPLADVYLGYLLKLIFPNIIWICDIRDIPVDVTKGNFIFEWFARDFYKRILMKANGLLCVSNGLCHNMKEYNKNCVSLLNGYNPLPLDLETLNLHDDSRGVKIILSYTGSLYDEQSIRQIRDILIDNKRVEIAYCGKDYDYLMGRINGIDLEKRIRNYGIIPYKKARYIQSSSDISLLLTWANNNQKGILTGKLYDYIGSKRPILCIHNGVEDGEIKTIFERYNLGLFYSISNDKAEDIMNFLLKVSNEGWRMNWDLIEKELSWNEVAKKLSRIICDQVERHDGRFSI